MGAPDPPDPLKAELDQVSDGFPALENYALKPGDEIAGCHIKGVLGHGGSGTVYRAEQLTLEREIALKVLSRDLAKKDLPFHERFLREARTAARLTHRNIVQIYDASADAENHFLIMEYVEGDSLDVLVEDGKPLPLDRSLEIFEGICEGLAYAHSAGVIHRDIKPANVVVGKDRTVKLMDFGLAKSQDSVQLTSPGQILGTPQYVSPEACNGDASDLRSDIYSLGATFYHVLTGHWLFPGETALTVMLKQMKEEPVHLKQIRPDLPLRLTDLVMKMLRKDCLERPQNVDEVLAEIKAIREGGDEDGPELRDVAPQLPAAVEEHRLPKGRLLCLTGALNGRKFPLRPDGITTIGRLSENDIGLLHQSVSRRHCRIEARDGGFSVTDRGSGNGCRLNGDPITESQLADGDILEVGQVRFHFRVLAAAEDACDLANILVERGALSHEAADDALSELTREWNKGSSESLGQLLVKKRVVSEDELEEALEMLDDRARQEASRQEGEAPPPDVTPASARAVSPAASEAPPPKKSRAARKSSGRPTHDLLNKIAKTGEEFEFVEPPGRLAEEPRPVVEPAQTSEAPSPFEALEAPEPPADTAPLPETKPTPFEGLEALEGQMASWPTEEPEASPFDELAASEPQTNTSDSVGPITGMLEMEDDSYLADSPSPSLPPGAFPCLRCSSVVHPDEIRQGTARAIPGGVLCGHCASSRL